MTSAPNPWSTVTGEVAPPPWQGPATVHRMPDDEEPKREPVEKDAPPDPSLIARRKVAAHVPSRRKLTRDTWNGCAPLWRN